MVKVAFMPGISPDKWFKRWQTRFPEEPLETVVGTQEEVASALLSGDVELALLRDANPDTRFHAIPLYEEVAVVLVPKDHVLTAFETATLAEVAEAEERMLQLGQDPGYRTEADIVELVAAGVGAFMAPLSVAKLHHRRDVRHIEVVDAPGYPVYLTWLKDRGDDVGEESSGMTAQRAIEEFIGIVRGRTENSSRTQPQEKKSARQKSLEKNERRKDAEKNQTKAPQPAGRGTARKPKSGSQAKAATKRGRGRRR